MAAKTPKALAKSLARVKVMKEKLEVEEKYLRSVLMKELPIGASITVEEDGRKFVIEMKEIIETVLADNNCILDVIGADLFIAIAKITKGALEAVKGKAVVKELIVAYNPEPRLYVKEV
jgi:hypothetical protein